MYTWTRCSIGFHDRACILGLIRVSGSQLRSAAGSGERKVIGDVAARGADVITRLQEGAAEIVESGGISGSLLAMGDRW